MNNSYFEKHLPYCVDVKESHVMILNRHYEMLAEGVIPYDADIKESFKAVASPCYDCYREIEDGFRCYLYDSQDNPFVSDKEFNVAFLAAYMMRFSLLHKLFIQTVA